ncbi:hypothetical protein SEVIR_7G161450v4 [Setaria viridis]
MTNRNRNTATETVYELTPTTISKRPKQIKIIGAIEYAARGHNSEVLVDAEDVVRGAAAVEAGHHGRLLVLPDALLEEVGLALQRDELHPVEWVGDVVHLLVPQRHEQAVGDELDVLAHEPAVHSDERDGERVADELALDVDGVGDDLADAALVELAAEEVVEEAGEVAVEALVAGDELVGEGEARHEAALLEPEDGAEGAREEDALNAGEGDEALGEALPAVDPAHGPVGLAAHGGDGVDGAEEVVLLGAVADVGLEKQRVHLRVDVLNGDLEAVEGARLGDLDVGHEAGGEVLEHDAVGGGEEGEHVGDEVALVGGERVPVARVGGEVHLLGSPEGRHRLLVELPDLRVPDREHGEAVRRLRQQGLLRVARGHERRRGWHRRRGRRIRLPRGPGGVGGGGESGGFRRRGDGRMDCEFARGSGGVYRGVGGELGGDF